jgi:hypothetical protein
MRVIDQEEGRFRLGRSAQNLCATRQTVLSTFDLDVGLKHKIYHVKTAPEAMP